MDVTAGGKKADVVPREEGGRGLGCTERREPWLEASELSPELSIGGFAYNLSPPFAEPVVSSIVANATPPDLPEGIGIPTERSALRMAPRLHEGRGSNES